MQAFEQKSVAAKKKKKKNATTRFMNAHEH